MCNIIVPRGERNQGFPLDHKNLRVDDRLGAERVLRAGLYTDEDIARQIEGSDLAATVAHYLEGAHRSADRFVEISSETIFAVDLYIARKHHGRAHLLDRPGERVCADPKIGRRSAVQLRPIDAKISATILTFHHDTSPL